MPAFTYFYKFRDDLQKFSSGQQPLNKWNEEAKSATATINADVIHAWKVSCWAVGLSPVSTKNTVILPLGLLGPRAFHYSTPILSN